MQTTHVVCTEEPHPFVLLFESVNNVQVLIKHTTYYFGTVSSSPTAIKLVCRLDYTVLGSVLGVRVGLC